MKEKTKTRRFQMALVLMVLLTCPDSVQQSAYGQDVPDPVQAVPVEIVVKGRQPGPPLWRVTHGDNVLWIFPYLSPVPEDMQWESDRVEQIIAESQAYLALPRTDINAPVRRSNLELSGEATLQDLLPPELYERYLVLESGLSSRARRGLEKLPPIVAGPSLLYAVLDRKGLGDADDILRTINREVRRNRNIETTEIVNVADLDKSESELFVSDISGEFSDAQGITCFESVLDRLATEVDARISRANAWASGDIDALREIVLPEGIGSSCTVSFQESEHQNELVVDLYEKTFQEWQLASEQALINNPSSFAVLGLDDLLKDDGMLNLLRLKGYTVIEPW